MLKHGEMGNATLIAVVGLIIAGSYIVASQFSFQKADTAMVNLADAGVARAQVDLAVKRALADAEGWFNAQSSRPVISSSGSGKYTYNASLSNYQTWSDAQWASNRHAPYQISNETCGGIGDKNLKCYWIIEETACTVNGKAAKADYNLIAYAVKGNYRKTASKTISLPNRRFTGPVQNVQIWPSNLSANNMDSTLCPAKLASVFFHTRQNGPSYIDTYTYHTVRGQLFTLPDTQITFSKGNLTTIPSNAITKITQIGMPTWNEYSDESAHFTVQISAGGKTTNTIATGTFSAMGFPRNPSRIGVGNGFGYFMQINLLDSAEWGGKENDACRYLGVGPNGSAIVHSVGVRLNWYTLRTPPELPEVGQQDVLTISVGCNNYPCRFATRSSTVDYPSYGCDFSKWHKPRVEMYLQTMDNQAVNSPNAFSDSGIFATIPNSHACADLGGGRSSFESALAYFPNQKNPYNYFNKGNPNDPIMAIRGTYQTLTCP